MIKHILYSTRLMKEYVWSLKEKSTQHWFSYFQIANKY